MKILHVSASYLPAVRYGGTIHSVHGLCKALAARGHDVHVYTTSVDGRGDSPVAHETAVDIDGVKVWYFQSRILRRLYWAPAMRRWLRAHVDDYDVVHTHAIYLWPLWTAARSALAAGVPYVMSPRGMLEKKLIEQQSAVAKSVLIGFIERYFLEQASAVHVTSPREAVELAKFGFRLPQVYEIPNGVDSQPPAGQGQSPQLANETGKFALFIGRIHRKKGLDRLIAALPHAPLIRLVVAGNDEDGYTGELQSQAERLGIADRVTFVGPVYGNGKSSLLSRAAFVVVPSYSENFGNVVLEALAHGTPVVLTPEVGASDLLKGRGVAVITDGAPAVLGSAMSALNVDDVAREAMGRRGRELIEREFQWSAIAKSVEAMYEQARSGA